MENVFNRSKKMAPSVLLIDPLQAIAVDNQQKRMDRSNVDDALLVQLFHILKEAKESGVTVVGMMNDDMTILPSVTLGFDETVCFSAINHSQIECYQPSQNDRYLFMKHISNMYMKCEEYSNEWIESYMKYLALNTFEVI